jgi:hypothetical protein
MKKFSILLTALVILLAFAACDMGTSGGGSGEAVYTSSGVRGAANLSLSGKACVQYGSPAFTNIFPYTKDITFTGRDNIGGSGVITNGNMTFNVSEPGGLSNFNNWMFGGYDDLAASPDDVQWTRLNFNILNSSIFFSKYKGTSAGTGNSQIWINEYVDYLYVDRDCTITGKGKTEQGNYNLTTTSGLNLSLKKGWNSVYRKETFRGTNVTTEDKTGDLTNGMWMVIDPSFKPEIPNELLESGTIYGLNYTAKDKCSDKYAEQGGDATYYLLAHSYAEASGILTDQFGPPVGVDNNSIPEHIFTLKPNWVIFQQSRGNRALFSESKNEMWGPSND